MIAAVLRATVAGVLALASATGLQSCTETTPADAELSAPEAAEVIAVVDGDTINVQTAGGEARVRLIGLDTPEINRDGGQDDCYAQEARDDLNALVYGQTVELRGDPTQDDRPLRASAAPRLHRRPERGPRAARSGSRARVHLRRALHRPGAAPGRRGRSPSGRAGNVGELRKLTSP